MLPTQLSELGLYVQTYYLETPLRRCKKKKEVGLLCLRIRSATFFLLSIFVTFYLLWRLFLISYRFLSLLMSPILADITSSAARFHFRVSLPLLFSLPYCNWFTYCICVSFNSFCPFTSGL